MRAGIFISSGTSSTISTNPNPNLDAQEGGVQRLVNHFVRLGMQIRTATVWTCSSFIYGKKPRRPWARHAPQFCCRLSDDRSWTNKSGVIAAFVSSEADDWRFSFVKLDYTFEKTDLGFVAERRLLTPARRSSYLVGANENCHTAQKQFVASQSDETDPTLAQLEGAFSVEKVTDEFYRQYKILFEKTRDALAAFLESAPAIKHHFNERGIACDDFAKKLLGQIVFLYFLQRRAGSG
jgi:hypothetical protein